jgi:hypothetical protein
MDKKLFSHWRDLLIKGCLNCYAVYMKSLQIKADCHQSPGMRHRAQSTWSLVQGSVRKVTATAASSQSTEPKIIVISFFSSNKTHRNDQRRN